MQFPSVQHSSSEDSTTGTCFGGDLERSSTGVPRPARNMRKLLRGSGSKGQPQKDARAGSISKKDQTQTSCLGGLSTAQPWGIPDQSAAVSRQPPGVNESEGTMRGRSAGGDDSCAAKRTRVTVVEDMDSG